jgi:hypothetical protein
MYIALIDSLNQYGVSIWAILEGKLGGKMAAAVTPNDAKLTRKSYILERTFDRYGLLKTRQFSRLGEYDNDVHLTTPE